MNYCYIDAPAIMFSRRNFSDGHSLFDESKYISNSLCSGFFAEKATKTQYEMLANLLKDGKIGKDSPAIAGYNSLSTAAEHKLPSEKPDLSNDAVLEATKIVFNYMKNDDRFQWKKMWPGQYEDAIKKGVEKGKISKNSPLITAYTDCTGRAIKV